VSAGRWWSLYICWLRFCFFAIQEFNLIFYPLSRGCFLGMFGYGRCVGYFNFCVFWNDVMLEAFSVKVNVLDASV
jgi:hypothetical protein